MSAQLSIFDIQSGMKARDEGIAKIIDSCGTYVETARGVARLICRRKGIVSMDDVREVLSAHGVTAPHPNAIGAVFKGNEWVPVGFMKSKVPSNHARTIRTWRLKTELK